MYMKVSLYSYAPKTKSYLKVVAIKVNNGNNLNIDISGDILSSIDFSLIL